MHLLNSLQPAAAGGVIMMPLPWLLALLPSELQQAHTTGCMTPAPTVPATCGCPLFGSQLLRQRLRRVEVCRPIPGHTIVQH